MNLYSVHPYIYLHVYTPNAYDTISLTLSFDNNITTVEQVNYGNFIYISIIKII